MLLQFPLIFCHFLKSFCSTFTPNHSSPGVIAGFSMKIWISHLYGNSALWQTDLQVLCRPNRWKQENMLPLSEMKFQRGLTEKEQFIVTLQLLQETNTTAVQLATQKKFLSRMMLTFMRERGKFIMCPMSEEFWFHSCYYSPTFL